MTRAAQNTEATKQDTRPTLFAKRQAENSRESPTEEANRRRPKQDCANSHRKTSQYAGPRLRRTYSNSKASREIQNSRPSEAKPKTRTCRIKGRSTSKAIAHSRCSKRDGGGGTKGPGKSSYPCKAKQRHTGQLEDKRDRGGSTPPQQKRRLTARSSISSQPRRRRPYSSCHASERTLFEEKGGQRSELSDKWRRATKSGCSGTRRGAQGEPRPNQRRTEAASRYTNSSMLTTPGERKGNGETGKERRREESTEKRTPEAVPRQRDAPEQWDNAAERGRTRGRGKLIKLKS